MLGEFLKSCNHHPLPSILLLYESFLTAQTEVEALILAQAYDHENEDLNSDPQQPTENLGEAKWT